MALRWGGGLGFWQLLLESAGHRGIQNGVQGAAQRLHILAAHALHGPAHGFRQCSDHPFIQRLQDLRALLAQLLQLGVLRVAQRHLRDLLAQHLVGGGVGQNGVADQLARGCIDGGQFGGHRRQHLLAVAGALAIGGVHHRVAQAIE